MFFHESNRSLPIPNDEPDGGEDSVTGVRLARRLSQRFA